jgi:basic membrane protein A
MKFKLFTTLFFSASLLNISQAFAENNSPNNNSPKICMIFDRAGKDDHSFNESTYVGFQKALATKEISNDSKIFEAKDDAQIQQAARSFVNSNCSLIFGIGVNVAEPMKKIIAQYPKQLFVTVDYIVEASNVRSIVFREDQGGFLVGAIAALKSKTQKIGFIAGMDLPLIERFKLGYESGAKFINPKIKIMTSFVGVSADGWNNPSKAEEIALSQYNQNVDIIFQAAGGSGIGIFNAAEKLDTPNNTIKRYAIGADSNQNWIKPGIILTSMLKGLGESVLFTIKDYKANKFSPGTIVYGVENKGIDWALDEHNKSIFTSEEIQKINSIKKDIASGKISVPDYYKLK